MENQTVSEIIEGIRRVGIENRRQAFMTPNGRNPVCLPGIGTGICERCREPVVSGKVEACRAVPPEERWDVRFD